MVMAEVLLLTDERDLGCLAYGRLAYALTPEEATFALRLSLVGEVIRETGGQA